MDRLTLLSSPSLAALVGLSGQASWAGHARPAASAPAQAAPTVSEGGETRRTIRVVYSGVITAR